jgi:hypothetical protein
MFTRNAARRGRTGGGRCRYLMPLTVQDFDGFLDQSVPVPSEFSRAGIVDKDSIPVACYGKFSAFLVKL